MLLWLFLISFSCSPHYITQNFEQRTSDHQTVAVLPFEMIYTGLRPEGLNESDINEISLAESRAFQISLFNKILSSTKSGKNAIGIDLQDYRKTLQLLEINDIDIQSSWIEQPEILADKLGVDAIIRSRIEKNRLMSDLDSYGISVAVHIMDVITDHRIWPWLPTNVAQSKKIKTSFYLVDGDDGHVLWSLDKDISADWRSRSDEIIDRINHQAAKKFPYRKQ